MLRYDSYLHIKKDHHIVKRMALHVILEDILNVFFNWSVVLTLECKIGLDIYGNRIQFYDSN